MIKYLGTILSLFLLSGSAYCQTNSAEKVNTLYVNPNFTTDYKTLHINVKYLNADEQGQLKDNLIVYREKVNSISLDEEKKELILEHSDAFAYREIMSLLKEHGISSAMATYKAE